MHRFLPLLYFLCTTPVRSFFHGTCLKKEPPPGVLVLSPGSYLVLSCDGEVKVDGAKVKVSEHISNNNNTGEQSSSETQTPATVTRSNKVLIKADVNTMKDTPQGEEVQNGTDRHLASPVHDVVQTSSTTGKTEVMDKNKVTRSLKGKWKLNGKTVGRGHWDWEGFTVGRSGTPLSVSSVQLKDSGNYSCHQRGRERFSIKVIVAGPATRSIVSTVPSPPVGPDAGAPWTTTRMSSGHFTWPTCASQAWRATPPAPSCPFFPWTFVKMIKGRRSFTITDALSGVEYVIQIRTQDEFDGLWSEWSAPVYGSSWTDTRTQEPSLSLNDYMFSEYEESSGTEEDPSVEFPGSSVGPADVPRHILWISCSFVVLATVIFAAYLYRHRERCLSKLHALKVTGHSKSSTQPAPHAPEVRALMTFDPPRSKEEGEKEGNEDERSETARREAVHFNNTHYFLIQSMTHK
ncbi:interleukin-6 receptor subunit alpha isoform X3 [Nerophis ophidion]|uniref:interleukin-6 receptor subunit alpha isoform X3 n=1 Tax=Nerophis ophidion TaxID=159077 RepID=UPI002ADF74D9|nr:interleukin-6 receptor subunit alpha isoform X3 [Nerophis ophidion]